MDTKKMPPLFSSLQNAGPDIRHDGHKMYIFHFMLGICGFLYSKKIYKLCSILLGHFIKHKGLISGEYHTKSNKVIYVAVVVQFSTISLSLSIY